MRVFLKDVLVICAMLGLFAAFLLITPHFYGPAARDRTRVAQAHTLKDALERYHRDHGSYPALPDNPVDDLKTSLVDGGYLSGIPVHPLAPEKGDQYRYVSDGSFYGLLFNMEVINDVGRSGACITGVKTAGTGIWGQPPDCPFS